MIMSLPPECQIGLLAGGALHVEPNLAGVVITPQAGLATWHLAPRRNVVPPIRTMVNAMKDQTLMLRIRAQIRLVEQRIQNGQPGLPVGLAAFAEIMAEPQQSLRGNRRRRTIDGLKLVERLGRAIKIVAELGQQWRARVPIRDAVGRRVLDVEI